MINGDEISLEKLLSGYNVTIKKPNRQTYTHYIYSNTKLKVFNILNDIFDKYDNQQTYSPENDLIIITKQEYLSLTSGNKKNNISQPETKENDDDDDLNDPRR